MSKGFEEEERTELRGTPHSDDENQMQQNFTASETDKQQEETASAVYKPKSGAPFAYREEAHESHSVEKNDVKKKGTSRSRVAFGAMLLSLCLILSLVGGAGGMAIALMHHPEAENPSGNGSEEGNTLVGSQNGTATLYKGMPVSVETVIPEGEELSVAQVYSKAAQSVVAISTSRQMTSNFYGGFYVTTGAGSGVILSEEGHIVTNYHVIDGATEVKVTLTNGEEYKGVYLDGDPAMDIALLKIEPQSALVPATIGSSGRLVIGQEVVAIGNPLGDLPGTVTDGIVSALDRKVEIEGYVRSMIQTNAAINPGNSGGGLFDRYGYLIGVVNAKNSSEGVEGLGFAIPIDAVFDDIVEIIEDGYIHDRACLDLDVKAITNPTDAFYLYRNQTAGVYIQNSRYESAVGLQVGDRIHAINGIEIRGESNLHAVLATLSPGDEVTVTVGRIKTISSGFWTSYKEEYFEVILPLIEYIPTSSITFR